MNIWLSSRRWIGRSVGRVSSHERDHACPAVIERSERSIHLAQRRREWHNSARRSTGGVVEWLMAPVLKTGRAQALVGSNPTPSATQQAIA